MTTIGPASAAGDRRPAGRSPAGRTCRSSRRSIPRAARRGATSVEQLGRRRPSSSTVWRLGRVDARDHLERLELVAVRAVGRPLVVACRTSASSPLPSPAWASASACSSAGQNVVGVHRLHDRRSMATPRFDRRSSRVARESGPRRVGAISASNAPSASPSLWNAQSLVGAALGEERVERRLEALRSAARLDSSASALGSTAPSSTAARTVSGNSVAHVAAELAAVAEPEVGDRVLAERPPDRRPCRGRCCWCRRAG